MMSSARLVVSPDAVTNRIGEELALLDFRTDRYFTLNPTAAAVWTLLSQPRSIDELCVAIGARFEVEDERLRTDLGALMQHLYDAKLVDLYDDAGVR